MTETNFLIAKVRVKQKKPNQFFLNFCYIFSCCFFGFQNIFTDLKLNLLLGLKPLTATRQL
jgi:hypothetical protein